jgi:hypothetical protein
MTAADTTARPPGVPSARRRAQRAGAVLAAPVIAYFAVRPWVASDAVALAAAGALPIGYQVVLVAVRRRIDVWALVSGLGFAVGCLASLLAGGSSLPLKLHEAAVTFVAGLVLLGAVVVRRPVPLGRLLKVPGADLRLDVTLSVLVGGFLVLHALLHIALAVLLPTSTYVVAGRLVNWVTIGLGAAALYGYLRRARRLARETRPRTGDRAA